MEKREKIKAVREEEREMMTVRKFVIISAVCSAVLAIIWVLQNKGPVETRILFFSVTMPQSVLLVLTLLGGIAVGVLLVLGRLNKEHTDNMQPGNRKAESLSADY